LNVEARSVSYALAYIALPNAIFLFGWIVWPLGPIAAAALALGVAWLLRRERQAAGAALGVLWVPLIAIAGLWTVLGGLGHFVFANSDWVVRDAVLLDLVRDPWPVVYRRDGMETLLRAPIGYFLPAALVGKALGVRAAELALFAWTVLGVSLVFALMLRDRPTLKAALIRIAVFIVFSGMDIVGTIAHYNPHALGDHLEWWAFLFQYSSQTTQLFWVPNHALPGWIAIAWLLACDPRRLPIGPAILFVAFAPLWSPLTAIGIAPIVGVAIVHRLAVDRTWTSFVRLFDRRALLSVIVPALACVVLVYPYLVLGGDKIASGNNADVRWVGEDFVPRYIEFVLFEFAGFALLLIVRNLRDALLWAAIVVLLALPFYRFGPYNDLAMRASIPALTLLAIRLGTWLSTPIATTKDPRSRSLAIVLLLVGAVTPFMEVARVFIQPRWDMNVTSPVIDVTRGTHYLTPRDRPWANRFLRDAAPSTGAGASPR